MPAKLRQRDLLERQRQQERDGEDRHQVPEHRRQAVGVGVDDRRLQRLAGGLDRGRDEGVRRGDARLDRLLGVGGQRPGEVVGQPAGEQRAEDGDAQGGADLAEVVVRRGGGADLVGGTAFCAARTTFCMIRPSPAPSAKNIAPIVHSEVSPDSVVIQTIAAMITATPATVKILYRPVLAMNVAELWIVRMMPDGHRQHQQAGVRGRQPGAHLQERGHEGDRREHAQADRHAQRRGDDEGPVAEQGHRDDRLDRPQLDDHEARPARRRTRRASTASARTPQPSWPPKSVNRISDVVVAESARMPA